MEVATKDVTKKNRFSEWAVLLCIPALIAASWLVGNRYSASGDQGLAIESIKAKNYLAERVNGNKWTLNSSPGHPIGLAYLGSGRGYGGPMLILTYTNTTHTITATEVLSHSETHSYYKKLSEKGFDKQLVSLNPLQLITEHKVDAVSGATLACRGIVDGVVGGYSKGEGLEIIQGEKYRPGLKEIFAIILIILGYAIIKLKRPTIKLRLLWLSNIVSLIVLGFILNSPLTLTQINAFVQGYLPIQAGGLFIVILLITSLLFPLVTGKNVYCNSVCPFGAAQRVIGLLGNPQGFRPRYYSWLKRLQWSLALLAILAALALGSPSVSDFTIFGNLFRLNGSAIAITVLIVVIGLSLLIQRPWCNFMCPIDGVFAYLKLVNIKIRAIWRG